MRWLAVVITLGVGFGFSFSSTASTCVFHERITFADGSEGCLADFPVLASARANGINGTVRDLAPRHGAFAVAAPLHAGCSSRVGVGRITGAFTPFLLLEPNEIRKREDSALASCESESKCKCSIVLTDARSPLSRDEFAMRFSGDPAAVPASVTTMAQRPSATPTAAEGRQAPPANVAGPSPSSSTGEELARMRQEMEAMRAQINEARRNEPISAPNQRSVRALVIGNAAYTHLGKLANPRNDAQAIAELFRRMGIETDLVLDADRDTLARALNEYSALGVGHDVNILYYAGHGVQVEGVNYLVPTNMRAERVTAGYVKLSGVSLDAVLDYLPAKTRLVFLDACRDNPVARSLTGTRSGVGVGLAPVATTAGTLISYATKDGATADDGVGPHSPYTTALLQHLASPQDIGIVLRSVRETVLRLTSKRQEPWEYGSLTGGELILSKVSGKR